ncbi:MAG: hypothetical protein O2862_01715 [Bacteroidetes bacterium]|nr:hypothetical protein [Bacteroidota bacterium]MDA0851604.1 hypothetical protein [Pseudomonadota bacterium]
MENKVWEILTEILEDYNQGVEKDEELKIEKSAVLFGDGSSVDSMALVNIVLNFEDNLNDEFSTDISLSDDNALNQSTSPYSTIGAIYDYAIKVLKA